MVADATAASPDLINSFLQLLVFSETKGATGQYRRKVKWTLKKSPMFYMRDVDSLSSLVWPRTHSLAACLPCYNRFLGPEFRPLNSTTYQKLIIKLKDPASEEQRNQMLRAIYTNVSSYYRRYISISDYYRDSKTLDEIAAMMDLIFLTLSFLTLFLCFFQLSSSVNAVFI